MGIIDFEKAEAWDYRIGELLKDLDFDPEYYSEFEHNFVRSLEHKSKVSLAYLTPKQAAVLARIWERHLKR